MLPKGWSPAVEPNSKGGERGDDTVGLRQVTIERRGSGQNDDSLSASRPSGGNVKDRVADHNDLSRAYSDRGGEGKHGTGVRLGAEARIVSGNEGQEWRDAKFSCVGAGGRFSVVGNEAEPITAGGELAEDGLGIIDRREISGRRCAEKLVDRGEKRGIRWPS